MNISFLYFPSNIPIRVFVGINILDSDANSFSVFIDKFIVTIYPHQTHLVYKRTNLTNRKSGDSHSFQQMAQMFKPFFTKMASSNSLGCSTHNNKPFTHMCLEGNCSEKVMCEFCVQTHSKSHSGSIYNIREYLETLHRSSKNKSNDAIFVQIRTFLDNKEDVLHQILQLHEEKERDVLGIFDQLKYEINETLDVAYQKYCNSLRSFQQKRMQAINRKIAHIQSMVRVQTCIQEKSFPADINEAEMHDLVKQFSKFNSQMSSLPIDLAEKYKILSELLSDESKLSLSLDHKRCDSIRMNILDLIREQFNIEDEFRGTPSTGSRPSDASKEKTSYNAQDNDICALVTLKDNLIATAGRDSKIKLWDLSTGECAGELTGHQDTVWDLQSAFDGKYLMSASADTTIKIWRVSEKKLKKTLKGHETGVYAMEFEERNNVLASGSQDGSLLLWNMNEGKISKKLEGHKNAIWSIKKLSEDRILSAGEDKEIKVWNIKTGGLLKSLRGHDSCIYGLSVFNNGKRFASCGDDGMICLWDAEKGAVVDSVQAHDKAIRSITVNENGTLIATGGYDKIVRVWDLRKMCLLKENANNDAVIRCVKFLSDSALLYCDTNLKNYRFSK